MLQLGILRTLRFPGTSGVRQVAGHGGAPHAYDLAFACSPICMPSHFQRLFLWRPQRVQAPFLWPLLGQGFTPRTDP